MRLCANNPKQNISLKQSIISFLSLAVISTVLGSTITLAQRQGNPNGGGGRTSALDEAEAAELTFVREEEKMARDVYLVMSETWGLPVFEQIALSEQEHMDAIKRMLDKYGLPDPAEGMGIGEFDNEDIKDLYDALILSGSESEFGALMAGAFIEEFDIDDLVQAIEGTDNADLQQVYGNLEAGSENHLRAFVGLIEDTGVVYVAQWLSQDEVDEILASTSESGNKP